VIKLPKQGKDPQNYLEITPDKPPVHDRQIVWGSYFKNSPKARKKRTCYVQAILDFVLVTARHIDARGLRTTWPWVTIKMCLRLRCSSISKKPLTLYDTLACYTGCPSCNFRLAQSGLLAHFICGRTFRASVEGEGNYRDPSHPLHCAICI